MDKGFQRWFLLHLSHAIKQIDKRQRDEYVVHNKFELRIQWLRLQRLTLDFVLDWFFCNHLFCLALHCDYDCIHVLPWIRMGF